MSPYYARYIHRCWRHWSAEVRRPVVPSYRRMVALPSSATPPLAQPGAATNIYILTTTTPTLPYNEYTGATDSVMAEMGSDNRKHQTP